METKPTNENPQPPLADADGSTPTDDIRDEHDAEYVQELVERNALLRDRNPEAWEWKQKATELGGFVQQLIDALDQCEFAAISDDARDLVQAGRAIVSRIEAENWPNEKLTA